MSGCDGDGSCGDCSGREDCDTCEGCGGIGDCARGCAAVGEEGLEGEGEEGGCEWGGLDRTCEEERGWVGDCEGVEVGV